MNETPPPVLSNYPRSPEEGPGPGRLPGVYFDTIKLAWNMVESNLLVYCGATFAVMLAEFVLYAAALIPQISASIASPLAQPPKPTPWLIAFGILLSYLSSFTTLGLIAIGVKQLQGFRIGFLDLFLPFRRPGTSALAALLVASPQVIFQLATMGVRENPPSEIGPTFVLLGIVSLFSIVLTALTLAPLLMAGTHSVVTGASPFEALRQTVLKLKGNWFALGVLGCIAFLLGTLGVMACLIGIVLTYPVFTNMIALHYTYYFPQPAGDEAG